MQLLTMPKTNQDDNLIWHIVSFQIIPSLEFLYYRFHEFEAARICSKAFGTVGRPSLTDRCRVSVFVFLDRPSKHSSRTTLMTLRLDAMSRISLSK